MSRAAPVTASAKLGHAITSSSILHGLLGCCNWCLWAVAHAANLPLSSIVTTVQLSSPRLQLQQPQPLWPALSCLEQFQSRILSAAYVACWSFGSRYAGKLHVSSVVLCAAQPAITQPDCRSSSRDISELHAYILDLVKHINSKYASDRYQPIVWLERPVPLYEKIALYSIADVAVVTATRDGMNLVPYEYIVCRQGAPVSFGRVAAACVGCCIGGTERSYSHSGCMVD